MIYYIGFLQGFIEAVLGISGMKPRAVDYQGTLYMMGYRAGRVAVIRNRILARIFTVGTVLSIGVALTQCQPPSF